MTQLSFDSLTTNFDGVSLIEASAGTGKTWTLVNIYIRLLLEKNLSVRQLLVVTFTEAATAELKERIQSRLADLLLLYKQEEINENVSGDDTLVQLYQKFNNAKSYRCLLLAVHGFDEAAIFTIHGFCQRSLQNVAFEAGIDFERELITDDTQLIIELINDLWRKELKTASVGWSSFLVEKNVTPQSLFNLLRKHINKPYTCVEPAFCESLDLEIFSTIEPLWKAAKENWSQFGEDWFADLLVFDGLKKNSYDIDKLLRWKKEIIQCFSNNFSVLNLPDKAIKQLSSDELISKTKKNFEPPISTISSSLQLLHEELLRVKSNAQLCLSRYYARFLFLINEQLPIIKANRRVLSFDDLLHALNNALHSDVNQHLAKTLREQYPVALVDEFQDTDPIQYQIFQHIYIQNPKERAENNNISTILCFVGDPKQAIYAFRGADLATYFAAREASYRQYTLTTNYRSTPDLIKAMNFLFARSNPFATEQLSYTNIGSSNKTDKKLIIDDSIPNLTALNIVWLADESLSPTAANSLSEEDTAIRISSLLNGAKQNKNYFKYSSDDSLIDKKVPLTGGDIAVLVNTSKEAGRIALALKRHGVSSVRPIKDSVWHTDEAYYLEIVLSAYMDPKQDTLLNCALITPFLGRTADDLIAVQSNHSAWCVEREAAERYHHLWVTKGFLVMFRLWLNEQAVAQRILGYSDGERQLTNLLHLADLLQEQSKSTSHTSIKALVQYLNTQRKNKTRKENAELRLESDADRVKILTIHSSKGLEFPLVFCPFLWVSSFGGGTKKAKDIVFHQQDHTTCLDLGSANFAAHIPIAQKEIFEERLRLAYVALTRAANYLWLHWGPVNVGKNNGELQSSAMSWLLHARSKDHISSLSGYIANSTPVALRSELDSLAEQSHKTICITTPLLENSLTQADITRGLEPNELNKFTRQLKSTWRIGSFSGLVTGTHTEVPERESYMPKLQIESGENFFAFPRGSNAGSCLHSILEQWILRVDPLEELIAQNLLAYNIDPKWFPVALDQIKKVLACDLDRQGLKLSTLDAKHCLPELEFTFPVRSLNVSKLQAVLCDPQYGLSSTMINAVRRLEFNQLNGFLKGFIDLTFMYKDRWYIVDYKSNWLGPDSSSYKEEQLLLALSESHYYLQYLIYLVALRRFLKHRLKDEYNDDLLGGAYYLFLRGMPEYGVYFTRPSDELLDALDTLFNGSDQ